MSENILISYHNICIFSFAGKNCAWHYCHHVQWILWKSVYVSVLSTIIGQCSETKAIRPPCAIYNNVVHIYTGRQSTHTHKIYKLERIKPYWDICFTLMCLAWISALGNIAKVCQCVYLDVLSVARTNLERWHSSKQYAKWKVLLFCQYSGTCKANLARPLGGNVI